MKMKLVSKEDKIFFAFEVSIILKGIHSILEIMGGILIFIINKTFIVSAVLSLTQEELSEDPKDLIAHYLINNSNSFSTNSQHFIALYLLSHGIIKLFLIIGLFRKKLWAYPASIIVFSLFIIYQLYRYYFTHSIWLLLFTIFDVVIIWLTLHEYRHRKNNYIKAH